MTRYCVEVCPYCDVEIELRWDPEEDGYKTYCPNCGNVLMLCDECMHSDDTSCDYCSKTGSCKHNPPKTSLNSTRLLIRREYFISRICHYHADKKGEGQCYGCVDRSKCTSDIFEKLLAYEETGLSPEEVKKLKKKRGKYKNELRRCKKDNSVALRKADYLWRKLHRNG